MKRLDAMPLGAAALAGTTFPIDRHYTCEVLGFSKVSENSMDAVSDRDFIMEFISHASICMIHLSRLSEELILWSYLRVFIYQLFPMPLPPAPPSCPRRRIPMWQSLSGAKPDGWWATLWPSSPP